MVDDGTGGLEAAGDNAAAAEAGASDADDGFDGMGGGGPFFLAGALSASSGVPLVMGVAVAGGGGGGDGDRARGVGGQVVLGVLRMADGAGLGGDDEGVGAADGGLSCDRRQGGRSVSTRQGARESAGEGGRRTGDDVLLLPAPDAVAVAVHAELRPSAGSGPDDSVRSSCPPEAALLLPSRRVPRRPAAGGAEGAAEGEGDDDAEPAVGVTLLAPALVLEELGTAADDEARESCSKRALRDETGAGRSSSSDIEGSGRGDEREGRGGREGVTVELGARRRVEQALAGGPVGW